MPKLGEANYPSDSFTSCYSKGTVKHATIQRMIRQVVVRGIGSHGVVQFVKGAGQVVIVEGRVVKRGRGSYEAFYHHHA